MNPTGSPSIGSRSMTHPGSQASVRREDVLRLVAEVQRLQNDLNGLTTGLRALLERTAPT